MSIRILPPKRGEVETLLVATYFEKLRKGAEYVLESAYTSKSGFDVVPFDSFKALAILEEAGDRLVNEGI